jgi:hypothetical protein
VPEKAPGIYISRSSKQKQAEHCRFFQAVENGHVLMRFNTNMMISILNVGQFASVLPF